MTYCPNPKWRRLKLQAFNFLLITIFIKNICSWVLTTWPWSPNMWELNCSICKIWLPLFVGHFLDSCSLLLTFFPKKLKGQKKKKIEIEICLGWKKRVKIGIWMLNIGVCFRERKNIIQIMLNIYIRFWRFFFFFLNGIQIWKFGFFILWWIFFQPVNILINILRSLAYEWPSAYEGSSASKGSLVIKEVCCINSPGQASPWVVKLTIIVSL